MSNPIIEGWVLCAEIQDWRWAVQPFRHAIASQGDVSHLAGAAVNNRSIAAFGLCLGFFALVANAEERILDRTFAVTPGGQLRVEAESGAITVVGGDTPLVVVQVVARSSQGALDRAEISAEQTSAGVEVVAKHDGGSWLGWLSSNRMDIRVTVTVPRQYNVDLKTSGGKLDVTQLNGNVRGSTSGGSIRVADVEGPVRMNTSGGGIQAERIGGDTYLRTSGGTVTAQDIGGDLDVQTSGGSIRIEKVRGAIAAHTSSGAVTARNVTGDVELGTSGGSIRAEAIDGKISASTSGGSVDVELVGANRGIRASTSGGSVTVRLPRATAASVDASTSGGSVSCELPVTASEMTAKKLRGTINGGGAEIQARTSGGSVRLVAREAG